MINDEEIKAGLLNRINREEFKIDALLGREDMQAAWNFNSENAQEYRRQMIPFYLLNREAEKYPVYLD